MPLSAEVKDLASVIARELSSGRATRQSVQGSKSVAFGWTGGLPVTLASFVTTVKSESLQIPLTKVAASGTPVAVVGPGAPKPLAVTIGTDVVNLKKFSGYGKATLEQILGSEGLIPAITSVLGSQALLEFEEDAMAVLDAETGTASASGADWASAIVAGQAAVLGNGGVPGVAVVSALDYPGLITAVSGSAGFATDSASPIGSFLGSLLHISPKLAAGKAYVLDASSVVAVEHVDSPSVLVDPFGLSDTNETRVIGDLIAATEVVNAAHVAEVTLTAP